MHRKSGLLLALAWAIAGLWARASVQLDIPPRAQWFNNNGYCGECCIQQCALYFGAYISQYRAREIIDPAQEQDVLVPRNSGRVLDALRLTYAAWNSFQAATPQHQSCLVWAKSHLQQKHPVILGVYVQGESDLDYDHIISATGFTSVDTNAYHPEDKLVFNDGFATTARTRTFGTLDDTRAMTGNGASYDYCIPRDVDFGCAVTGIKDGSGAALPVSLKLDQRSEPNISLGRAPVQLNTTIQVGALTNGAAYVLLRYNDYHNVPTSNYLSSAFDSATRFVATNSTQTMSDQFMSDATVIYRCVPALPAAPAVISPRNSFQQKD
jgi:hypothetical protein